MTTSDIGTIPNIHILDLEVQFILNRIIIGHPSGVVLSYYMYLGRRLKNYAVFDLYNPL